MRTLLKLEFFKLNLKRVVISMMGMQIGFCFFATIAIFGAKQDGVNDFQNVIQMVVTMIIDCFLIFAGILTAKIIVSEYTKRTILLLFTYSYKKREILFAKILTIDIIIIFGALVSSIICVGYLCILDHMYNFIIGDFDKKAFALYLKQVIILVNVLSLFVFMPISIAIIKRRESTVFISSLLMLFIVQMIISQAASFAQTILLANTCGITLIMFAFMSVKRYWNRIVI